MGKRKRRLTTTGWSREDRIAVGIDHDEAREPGAALVGFGRELHFLRPGGGASFAKAARGKLVLAYAGELLAAGVPSGVESPAVTYASVTGRSERLRSNMLWESVIATVPLQKMRMENEFGIQEPEKETINS